MPDMPGDAPALTSAWRRIATPELRSVVGLGVAAAIIAAFATLASEVLEGETRSFDRTLLLALRVPGHPDTPIGPRWLHHALVDFTALGGTPVLTLLTLLAVGYLLAARKRDTAIFLTLAIGGGSLLGITLKMGFARPRPELVSHLVQVYNPSFPSGHATNSAVTFLTLGVLLARAEASRRVKLYLVGVATLLTFIVGCSRVYLGVHWPTDVLAGWVIGAAWALLCWSVALWLQRRRTLEPSAPPTK